MDACCHASLLVLYGTMLHFGLAKHGTMEMTELLRISDNPVVALNRAVAVAMARSATAGLELLDQLQANDRIVEDHRFHAVRAHVLERAGHRVAARDAFLAAAQRATNLPQQRRLYSLAARLTDDQ